DAHPFAVAAHGCAFVFCLGPDRSAVSAFGDRQFAASASCLRSDLGTLCVSGRLRALAEQQIGVVSPVAYCQGTLENCVEQRRRDSRSRFVQQWTKPGSEHAAWELIMTKSIRGSEVVAREEIGALCMWGTSSSEGGCAYCLRSDNTVRFLRLCQSPLAADAPLSPEAQAEAQQLKQLQEEMQRELEATEKSGSARRRRPPKAQKGAEDELDAARELRLALSPHLQRAQKELRKRRAARQRAADAREQSREEAAADNQERSLRPDRQDAVAVIWQRSCAYLRERHREKEDASEAKKDEAAATERDEEAKDVSEEQESESKERKAAKEKETSLELSPSLLCALACIGVHTHWLCRAVQLGCASGGEATGDGERLRSQAKHGKRGRDSRFKAGQRKHRAKEQLKNAKVEAQTKETRAETDEKEAAPAPDVCRPQETVETLTPPQEETENDQPPESSVPSPASVSSLPTASSPAVASPTVSAPAEAASDASPEAVDACTETGLASACTAGLAAEAKLAFSACPACGFVAYCSEECRIKDLPLHLFICAGRH
ncbi:MYND finger protein, partial [Toxoplasma gondii MAS]